MRLPSFAPPSSPSRDIASDNISSELANYQYAMLLINSVTVPGHQSYLRRPCATPREFGNERIRVLLLRTLCNERREGLYHYSKIDIYFSHHCSKRSTFQLVKSTDRRRIMRRSIRDSGLSFLPFSLRLLLLGFSYRRSGFWDRM